MVDDYKEMVFPGFVVTLTCMNSAADTTQDLHRLRQIEFQHGKLVFFMGSVFSEFNAPQ